MRNRPCPPSEGNARHARDGELPATTRAGLSALAVASGQFPGSCVLIASLGPSGIRSARQPTAPLIHFRRINSYPGLSEQKRPASREYAAVATDRAQEEGKEPHGRHAAHRSSARIGGATRSYEPNTLSAHAFAPRLRQSLVLDALSKILTTKSAGLPLGQLDDFL